MFEINTEAENTGKSIRIRYFAQLRDERGAASELITELPPTAGELYEMLKHKYGFSLNLTQIRVAINGSFADMNQNILVGDELVFIPPVSGG